MSLTARLARLPAADSALPQGSAPEQLVSPAPTAHTTAGMGSTADPYAALTRAAGTGVAPGHVGVGVGMTEAPIRAEVPPGTAGPHAAVLTAGTGPAPAGTAHPAGTSTLAGSAAITQPPAPPPVPSAPSPPAALVRDVRADVVLSLGADLNEGRLAEGSIRNRAVAAAQTALRERSPDLPPEFRDRVVVEVLDDILGLGPVEPLLRDGSVSEIMINGYGTVYVERRGVLQQEPVSFRDEAHLRRTIERIVARVGRRIDESSPMVDARLADGSRVNAVIPPICLDGASLTIRKFVADAWSMDDLIGFGTLSSDAGGFLAMCVAGRLNVLVSGGTGTGKTTLLSALSSFVPEGERLITIEDAAELRLDHRHLVRLESRPPSAGGTAGVTIRDLLRNALRMRPDRIIVGEVRDGAALDMLQAMNTGHDGSLGTVHASSVRDALRRIETMVLIAGLDVPVRAIRDQIGSGIDVVVHLERAASGARVVTDIAEIVGLEGEVVTVQSLFSRSSGVLAPTGFEPRFWPRIRHLASAYLPTSASPGATA